MHINCFLPLTTLQQYLWAFYSLKNKYCDIKPSNKSLQYRGEHSVTWYSERQHSKSKPQADRWTWNRLTSRTKKELKVLSGATYYNYSKFLGVNRGQKPFSIRLHCIPDLIPGREQLLNRRFYFAEKISGTRMYIFYKVFHFNNCPSFSFFILFYFIN